MMNRRRVLLVALIFVSATILAWASGRTFPQAIEWAVVATLPAVAFSIMVARGRR